LAEDRSKLSCCARGTGESSRPLIHRSGLMTAARLKALGVNALIIERNSRIGDNWRGRYEALSLHLPHWGGES
jgi:hypothetical protein